MHRAVIIITAFLGLLVTDAFAQTDDPNPAVNHPDKQAWTLFLDVNASAASQGNNDALFETWANDGDTFKPTPTWPAANVAKAAPSASRALSFIQRQHARIQVVPGGKGLISEETRRNRPDFDFIVHNNLYKVSGLKTAYASGNALSFPIDSLEVKANWVEVSRLKEFNGFSGSAADAEKVYHVNTAAGKKYALVAFHIISKLVPNWTWATFEHKDNPGRCDVIGCRDNFGAKTAYVAPVSPTESKTHYPDCVKSDALKALFAKAKIDPAFSNYCLKGSQADFIDSTGLAIRLGNSVTEQGFVAQASCMTCHGRAAFDQTGRMTSFAGFDPVSNNIPIGPNNGSNAPIGSLNSTWFWAPSASGPPYLPSLLDEQNITRIAQSADFVWSIPFCAIDDTASPPETTSKYCANK
jgi:hypothetical protein